MTSKRNVFLLGVSFDRVHHSQSLFQKREVKTYLTFISETEKGIKPVWSFRVVLSRAKMHP